jgi:hypothetical protein
MRRYRIILVVISLCLCGLPATAERVTIESNADATLIESPNGGWANGSGPFFFAGRTGQERNFRRRGLLRFDVAGALPPGAIVESASLTLYLWPSNPGSREMRLHRVLAAWGEGPSSASGGSGAPSEPGDATWLHRYYDQQPWVREGGQFVARAAAWQNVDESGFYTWASTPQLVADVRLWAAAPCRNFGWILVGDESESYTAKRFASREHPDLTLRPVLEVTYRLPGRRVNDP